MSKTAVVIYSDPKSGSDEALGRLLNGLFVAHELKQKHREVAIIFQGAGTRWAAELTKSDHPAYALFDSVKDRVAGICGGCADAFGATDDAQASGIPLVHELEMAGTSGIIDLSRYLDDGYQILNF